MKPVKLQRVYPVNGSEISAETVVDGIFTGLIVSQIGYLEALLVPAELLWEEVNQRWLGKKGEFITVNENGIIFQQNEEPQAFLFSEMESLKINYNPFAKKQAIAEDFDYIFSNISFDYGDQKIKVFYRSRKKHFITICKHLYDKRIRFKEYYTGRRTFMSKQPRYQQIQELKEKYDLEW